MTTLYFSVAAVLIVSLGGGLIQVWRGPTPGDRFLLLQLFGTAAVAVLILVGEALDAPAFVDIALLLALLAAVTMLAFARLTWTPDDRDEPRR